MFLTKAVGDVYLKRNNFHAVALEVAARFSVGAMGQTSQYKGRVKLRVGEIYLIVYKNRDVRVSWKTITVLGRLRG